MSKKSYSDKLRDPRWQKKRLEILNRDNWECKSCFDNVSTLHIHHQYYLPKTEPWDHPDTCLITLCEDCHKQETIDKGIAVSMLIRAMGDKRFLSMDIERLANVVNTMHVIYAPEIFLDSLKDALSNRDFCKRIVNCHLGDDIQLEDEDGL